MNSTPEENSISETRRNILHYSLQGYDAAIARAPTDSFLSRHENELEEVKSISHDDRRLEVPGVFLDETVSCLNNYAVTKCADPNVRIRSQRRLFVPFDI
jgi:hypothetical protein